MNNRTLGTIAMICAPAMLIDHTLHENVRPEQVPSMLGAAPGRH